MHTSMTRENLATLHQLTDAVNAAKERASELLRTAQDRFNDRVWKLEREGKEIELTEKVLWEETFYLGTGCQAAQILRKEHPEVFEAYKEQDRTAAELKKFCVAELGVDYTQLTLSDYLRLTESLFSLLIEERIKPAGSGGAIVSAETSGTSL